MIDGFPTTAACNAMSTGCLLVSANPQCNHTVLTPGRTHIELADATVDALVAALECVRADPRAAATTAAAGQHEIRTQLDVVRGTRARLELMGLL